MRALYLLMTLTLITVAGASCYGGPSIVILSPSAGTVPAGDITIKVRVRGFTISDQLVKTNVSGEGHLHYFYDFEPPTQPGVPAVAPEGSYAASISTSYNWHAIPAGTHSFAVELVNNDNTPLQPAVVAAITIAVEQLHEK